MLRPSMTSPPRAPIATPPGLLALAGILDLAFDKKLLAELRAAIGDYMKVAAAANATLVKIARHDQIDALHAEALTAARQAAEAVANAAQERTDLQAAADVKFGSREAALEQGQQELADGQAEEVRNGSVVAVSKFPVDAAVPRSS